MREKPEVTRDGVTHRVAILAPDDTGKIVQVTLYMTANTFPDGRPCEIFLRTGKQGSTVDGLLGTIATLTSVALQSGVELRSLVDKFAHSKFEPAGWTQGETPIKQAKSLVDYVFRWLEIAFLDRESTEDVYEEEPTDLEGSPPEISVLKETFKNLSNAPICPKCGAVMIPHGACFSCHNCGETSGCG